MKPVAYMSADYRMYFDGSQSYIPLAVEVSLVNLGWKNQIELFTADQLRAAQVAILREAADECAYDADREMLRRMADELERTK